MAKDFYQILGVPRTASKEEIKKAFRTLAHKYHPDKKTGDEKKFKEITEAYSILSDDARRREYDSYGRTFSGGGGGQQGFGGFDFSNFQGFQNGGGYAEFDLSDLFGGFGDIFGGGRTRTKRGRDISIDLEISFKDAIFGTTRNVILAKVSVCSTCDGSGAKKGTKLESCTLCNGAGQIHETRQSPLGVFTSARVCTSCEGAGEIPKEKGPDCAGAGVRRQEEDISITVPAGLDDGEVIRLPGKGEAVKGGTSGDLYIKVRVKKDSVFRKEGIHLVVDVPVKVTDALLGTTTTITTLDDKKLEVKIPPMKSPEETLRVRGKGVALRHERGDLLLKLSVVFPNKLSSKATKLIKELSEEGL